jgi:hypothetical protein
MTNKPKPIGDRAQTANFMWHQLVAKTSYAEVTAEILEVAARYALAEGVKATEYKALQLIAETAWKRGFVSALLAQELGALKSEKGLGHQ